MWRVSAVRKSAPPIRMIQALSQSDIQIANQAEPEAAYELLARRLSDLLLTGMGSIAPHELALAEAALVDLLPFLREELKRRLVERLVPLEMVPQALLAALLAEPLSVSGPLVSDGLCLTSCDLVHFAEAGGLEHRLCVAQRRDLSRVVCDALTVKGEIEVLRVLVGNTTASLSERAIEMIARRSSAEPDLIMMLLNRRELTPWFAHLMFWWADGEERSAILKRFPIDRRAVVEALDDLFDLESLIETESVALHSTYRLLRPARRLENEALQALIAGVDVRSTQSATSAMAAAADISPKTASWVISDEGGEPLAVLGKALGLSRSDFRDVASHLGAARLSGAYTENEMERAVALFDSVTMDRADSILHFWDRIVCAETRT